MVMVVNGMLKKKTCHSAISVYNIKKKTYHLFKINIALSWSVPGASLTHSTNNKDDKFTQLKLTADQLY